jgi:hypothetical protein
VSFLPRTPARVLLAGVLLVLVAGFLLLPPAPTRLDQTAWSTLAARTVAGAYHVHSSRSDGAADKATIAEAAARAGLRFVILTDHGDGTRPADPPAYSHGVLCFDAVEISTDEGHYVALDMQRSTYPLGGAASAVVEDVARLGGFGIAAHPDSEKPALRWTDANAWVNGIEWLNGDSEWRDETRRALWLAAIAYPFRPGPALARLLDRPATLDRWDQLTRMGPVVGVAGLDAHGGIGRRNEDGNQGTFIRVPNYTAMFRTFSTRVVLDRPWSGDAASDARALMTGIRSGRVYSTIDAIAANGLLDFHAEDGPETVLMGGLMPPGATATLVAHALKPAGARIVLLHEGQEIGSATDDLRQTITYGQGAYRVEVHVPHAPGTPPIPWMVSNPIYFLNTARPVEIAVVSGQGRGIPPGTWRIEKDPGSSAVLRTSGGGVEFEYSLKDGPRSSQYAALAADVGNEPFRRVRFSLAADRPMRVSVQLRAADGRRWGRSVYVPPDGRVIGLDLADFKPIGVPDPALTDSRIVRSVLLVVDLTNTAPGKSGQLRVRTSELMN